MLTRSLRIAIAAATVLAVNVACAQVPGTEVFPQGPITPGNCAMWISQNVIGDAGKVCGGAPPSCTGTIDLSTGCAQPMLGGM